MKSGRSGFGNFFESLDKQILVVTVIASQHVNCVLNWRCWQYCS